MDHLSRNEAETEAFAVKFVQELSQPSVVCLRGGLGAGKSVFCRALIRALCGMPGLEVPSPTFTLAQVYEGYPGQKFPIWHFDLYRLSAPEEVYEIGWEEAVGAALVLIEWPERVGALLPERRTDVTLSSVPGEPNHRIITIERHE